MKSHIALKLIAKDQEDLQVCSAHLQDAIIPITSISYNANDKTFSALANRYCWEHYYADENTSEHHRVHCGICFHNVSRVRHRGFHQHGKLRMLNLLTMHHQHSDNGEDFVRMIFSDDNEIYLNVDDLHCLVADVSEPWTTDQRPKHVHEYLVK